NRSDKNNAEFMRVFRSLGDDLVPLDEVEGVDPARAKRLAGSPLGRIYTSGVEELQVRKQRWGSQPLSSEAISAMHAAASAV
ncbi:hypothetical protein ABTH35_20470, partial [Acinetobacter baumannii]